MAEWEAPAKINLDLRVRARDGSGMHPLRSLAQTIDWLDTLLVEEDDEDALLVAGADLPTGGDNLIWQAVAALDVDSRPRLFVELDKQIPVAAGLGGGSSDAAAMLAAVADMTGLGADRVREAAVAVGADVPFFLQGGTAWMEGYGEHLTALAALQGFAVAVAVAPFELATPHVYRRWDEMEGPIGSPLVGSSLPPALRAFDELRNDLTPAAISLRPELADWMRDLADRWSRPVLMSGSGPACFGFFVDLDEATEAAATAGAHRGAVAADLRTRGVERRS